MQIPLFGLKNTINWSKSVCKYAEMDQVHQFAVEMINLRHPPIHSPHHRSRISIYYTKSPFNWAIIISRDQHLSLSQSLRHIHRQSGQSKIEMFDRKTMKAKCRKVSRAGFSFGSIENSISSCTRPLSNVHHSKHSYASKDKIERQRLRLDVTIAALKWNKTRKSDCVANGLPAQANHTVPNKLIKI